MSQYRSRAVRPGQTDWERNADRSLLISASLAELHPDFQPKICLSSTKPDLAFKDAISPIDLRLVYFDGPPHLNLRTEEKDEQVDKCLHCLNIPHDRYPYDYPLSEDRRLEIMAALEETFGVKD